MSGINYSDYEVLSERSKISIEWVHRPRAKRGKKGPKGLVKISIV